MATYCTNYEVRIYSQVKYSQLEISTDNQYQEFIDSYLVPQAQKVVDSYCNHDFDNHTGGTITLDGTGKDYVMIPPAYTPLRSVSSVKIDDVSKTLSDFKVYDQYIVYDGGTFTEDPQNVEVVADYGYTSVPSDVSFVCAMLCAGVLREMVRSKMLPDKIVPLLEAGGSVTGLMGSPRVFTEELKQMLRNYVFIQIEVG